MQALPLYYSTEILEKLERLAELTSYQEYSNFRHKLNVLDWCAVVLATMGEQVGSLPLEHPADLPAFLDGLDQAGTTITQFFDAFFQRSQGYQYIGSYLFERVTYPFSEDYLERRAKIAAGGKESLLARFTTRFASK